MQIPIYGSLVMEIPQRLRNHSTSIWSRESLTSRCGHYSNNGCTDKFILSPGVTVEPAGEIRFSTVFTPNLDGPIDRTDLPTGGTEIDQFFFPPIREKVIDYKLQIFNRLGVLIFESHDINIPWNGYYKGSFASREYIYGMLKVNMLMACHSRK